MSAPPPVSLDLRSPRGPLLSGLLHEPEAGLAPKGLVVLSPCFTCTRDIAPVRSLARDLADAGYLAYRFDPAGSGKSEGRFEDATVSRYVGDLVTVARALEERLPGAPLVLAGHSLGGVTSLLAAEELRPRAIVTLGSNARRDSFLRLLGPDAFERAKRDGSVPFDSGDGVLRPLTRELVVDLEHQDPLGAAARLACPLLVLHGDADAVVPVEAARVLAAAAGARATLEVLPGGQHLLTRGEDRARIREAVLGFLARVLPRVPGEGTGPAQNPVPGR